MEYSDPYFLFILSPSFFLGGVSQYLTQESCSNMFTHLRASPEWSFLLILLDWMISVQRTKGTRLSSSCFWILLYDALS